MNAAPFRPSRFGTLRRLIVFCVPLTLFAVAVSPLHSQDTKDDNANANAKQLRLVIKYGDGVEKHFTSLTWRENMTVLDLMNAAQKHKRGIRFVHRGKKSTGFLTQIDDLKNEGRGRNWIFRVNGKLGTKSFAIQKLKQGDAVSWTFGKYSP